MKIVITGEDFSHFIEHLKSHPSDMFLVDQGRYLVARRRYLEAKEKGEINITDEQNNVWEGGLEHNLSGLESFGAVARTNRLIRPLYAIDRVFWSAQKLRALCVGPRTEMELFSLVAQGFSPENIRGLDLFSYSPWVDVGNMHQMPYPDNSFDVVIAGWVLVYSSDPELACKEFLRVVRDNGIIAIGSTYMSPERRQKIEQGRTDKHYPKADELLARFGSSVRNVYVRHESSPELAEGRTIVIFDVKKEIPPGQVSE